MLTQQEAREIVQPQVAELLARLRALPADDRPALEDVVGTWASAMVSELVAALERAHRGRRGRRDADDD